MSGANSLRNPPFFKSLNLSADDMDAVSRQAVPHTSDPYVITPASSGRLSAL